MPDYDRASRQAEELRRGLDAIIRNEVKDPRIPEMFSILKVDLTRDLKYAKVYISVMLKEEAEKKAMLKALKGASGFIRRELGKKIIIRSMPELSFVLDDSIEYSVHINRLLEQISTKEEDAKTDGEDQES